MKAPALLSLIDQEAGAFQRIDNKWRPQNLLFELQMKTLMDDMTRRFNLVVQAESEFQGLIRAAFFVKSIRQLNLILKRANFVRRINDLAFIQAVSDFYSVYGEMLRYLKIDQARGQLQPI